MEKLPVHIISGFLGSGKTTAIIQLLGQKTNNEQWAVIINEFGRISIDGQTLRSSSFVGNVFDIAGGCICCSAKEYFSENLSTILLSGNYCRIIIEPSGLGGIDLISEIVEANTNLQLMPVICLVDILGIDNPRLQLNPIYRMQITKAKFIAFSKCDLLPDNGQRDHLIDQFKTTFTKKQKDIILSTNLLEKFVNIDYRAKPEENKYRMIFESKEHLTDSNYQEINFRFDTNHIFDPNKVVACIGKHPSVVRAKGFVQTKNGWTLFHFTLSGSSFEPCLSHLQNELVLIADKSEPHLVDNLGAEIEKAIH